MSFFGFARGTYIIDCNSQISNSNINTSTIDMNGGVISSHGTPVNLSDVVNKEYVDSLSSSGIPEVTVTLTGTSYTTIISALSGVLIVMVKNVVTDGPNAIFLISKSENNLEASIQTPINSPGLNTGERLNIRWLSNNPIELHKNDINYNGDYKIKYILLS